MPGAMRVASRMNNWEEMYQRGETHWDRGSASPPLAEWVTANRDKLNGRVIVIGCGTGHDVAFLHRQGVDVWGLDIAPTALEKAKAQYPEVPTDHWLCEDLFNPPSTLRRQFDVVVEHTCLSGIPPELRTNYRDGVLALSKPGGLIAGVWFINPDLEPDHVGPPYPLPVERLDAMFAAAGEVLEDYVPKVAFPGRDGRERVRVIRVSGA